LRARTARLMELYEDFQSPARRALYPTGSFREFQQHVRIEEKSACGAETDALLELARDWRKSHLRRELLHGLAIASVVIGGIGLVLLLALVVIWTLGYVQHWWTHRAESFLSHRKAIQWGQVGAGVAILLSALGITGFLTDYVGDVEQYTTYEETDKLYARRKKVLADATRQLLQVLNDPNCERVVIAAHSLGSAVAVDSMLELARSNRASGVSDPLRGPIPLSKIEHLVTYGSPVDKINYFFYVVQSSSGSYEELAEDIRGDIGTPPFSDREQRPHIHWINYWDKGDIIGGPTETVANSRLGQQEVDNVRVANYVLPDLAGSHGAYTDRRDFLKLLLDVILFRRYSYVAPAVAAPPGGTSGKFRQGPGEGRAAQTLMYWLFVVTLPWALLLASLEIIFGWRTHRGFFAAMCVVVAVHALGLIVHKLRRRKRRIEVDRVAGAFGAPDQRTRNG
jgi:hypothetical protein